MTTFAEDVERAVPDDEPIQEVVTRSERGDRWSFQKSPDQPVRQWSEVRPELDYEYDTGFGGADCHAITAYTENWIIVVAEYDGSTHPITIPRNPRPHKPEFA